MLKVFQHSLKTKINYFINNRAACGQPGTTNSYGFTSFSVVHPIQPHCQRAVRGGRRLAGMRRDGGWGSERRVEGSVKDCEEGMDADGESAVLTGDHHESGRGGSTASQGMQMVRDDD